MSKDKFVFEWRVDDKYKIHGIDTVWTVLHPEVLQGALYVPHGKTKKRYKAEKLAWKQSRIKAGDSVEIICGYHFKFPKGFKGVVDRIDDGGDLWINDFCVMPKRVKPCKPPKPEKPVLESEFTLDDGWVKGNNSSDLFKYDGEWAVFEIGSVTNSISPNGLRMIADLLESQA